MLGYEICVYVDMGMLGVILQIENNGDVLGSLSWIL